MLIELYEFILNYYPHAPRHAEIGVIARFQVGNKKNKNGWISVFDGGAIFGDWVSGDKYTWFEKSDNVELTESEKMNRDFARSQALEKALKEREQSYIETSNKAQQIYSDALLCDNHTYLLNKSVAVCDGLKIALDGRLIVPVYDCKTESIQSLQFIDNDGNKQFLSKGKMKNGCFVIGDLVENESALLCEGLSTGLTLHSASKQPVIVSFNAGNLPDIYNHFKTRVKLTVCGDNDKPGRKAVELCKDANAIFPPEGQDFNDIGIEETKRYFNIKDDESLFISVSDLMTMDFKTNWLIKGVIERGALGMVFGESGAGKSLFTLDWAYCLATGTNWHGYKVKKAEKVMYIAGEGSRGFKMRLSALNQKYSKKIKDNLVFSKKSFNFLDKKTADSIIEQVEKMDFKPSIIFIDTLHRNMIGDENKAEDMGQFLATIEILSKKYECTIVVVHHSGIADKGRARGSSSTHGGMDFVFCVSKSNDYETTITCLKMKDNDKTKPLKFLITKIELDGAEWYDAEDEKQTTGVYLAYQGVDTEKEQKLSKRDELALEALVTSIDELGKVNVNDLLVVGIGDIKVIHAEDYRNYFNLTCKGKNKTRDFDESLKSLVNRRYAGRDGNYLWLIEE